MYVAVFISIVTVLQRRRNRKEWRTCSRRGGDNGGDERSREFVEGAVSVVASGYDEVCLRMKGMVRSKIVIKVDSIY